jgi:hypothetical protein
MAMEQATNAVAMRVFRLNMLVSLLVVEWEALDVRAYIHASEDCSTVLTFFFCFGTNLARSNMRASTR